MRRAFVRRDCRTRSYKRIRTSSGFMREPPVHSKEPTTMRKNLGPRVDRRKFLKGVAIASAAGTVNPQIASATTAAGAGPAHLPSALPPTAHTIAAETGTSQVEVNRIGGVPGSDFMVDVIKSLDIKYLPANCASSYRGIHESLINYGGNKMPEIIMGGNDLDAAHRPPGVPTTHSAQDINALVRDFTKWDDNPVSLQHFAQSFVRAV